MKAIISLSPWATVWSMGNKGGTPMELIGINCLKEINQNVLHFVEEGEKSDEGNIQISVHLGQMNKWIFRIFGRLGYFGEQVLFKIRKRKWIAYNNQFYNMVNCELKKRNISEVLLVYCHTSLLVECGRKIGMTYDCPVVSYFYGTFLAPCIGNLREYRKHATEYLGWTTPVDLRICLNDGTQGLEVAKDLGLPMDKFLFQPHGLNISELTAGSKSSLADDFFSADTIYVMTASRLASWKRVDRLIKAIPAVVKCVKCVKFLILGDGPERKNLEEMVRNLNVNEFVKFLGTVPYEVVFDFMKRCDVFVSTNDLSNLSIGMKQAMYLGMCVIATDVGDTRLLINNDINGKLVSADDINALAVGLIELLSDSKTRNRLGKAAQNFIQSTEPTVNEILHERVNAITLLISNKREHNLKTNNI